MSKAAYLYKLTTQNLKNRIYFRSIGNKTVIFTITTVKKMIIRNVGTQIKHQLHKGKAIILLGARQVGKSTMLKQVFKTQKNILWLDAENADVPLMLAKATSTSLKNIYGKHKIVVIDEAQKIPNIGSVLKLSTDYLKTIQVIATGSSAFELRNKTNEPLTGRKWEYNLYPLSFNELVTHTTIIEEKRNLHHRLLYGSYPEIVLNLGEERERLKLLIDSYLYKDILLWSGLKKPEKIVDLLKALALQIGSEVSYNELANKLALKSETVENYIQILEQTFIIFKLPAYSNNVRKELRRGRKYYFFDIGLRNALINDFSTINTRQDIGAIWENFIISELWKKNSLAKQHANFYFWRTQDQQKIDLILEQNKTLHAIEIKWNAKAKVKFSKTFSNNYPNNTLAVITPDNYNEFLM